MTSKRRYFLFAVSVTITATIGLLYSYSFLPLLWIETRCDDLLTQYAKKAPVSNQIHFDESVLKENPTLQLMLRPFPWSREIWATLLTTLFKAKVKLVVFDLYFDKTREGDAAFKSVLDTHQSQVVMGCMFDSLAHGAPTIDNCLTPHESILGTNWEEGPLDTNGVVGHTYVPKDWDGVRRSFQKNDYSLGECLPIEMLMGRAIRKIGRPKVLAACNQRQRFRFAGGPGTFTVIPIQEVLTTTLWKSKYDNGVVFENKIVVIGSSGNWSGDQKQTPFPGLMDGTEVQINILNAMLEGELLTKVSRWWALCIIVMAGVCGFMVANAIKTFPVFWPAIIGGNVLYFAAACCAYNSFNLIVPMVSPIITFTCVLGQAFTPSFAEKATINGPG